MGRPKQTHCKHGHELTEDNVYRYGNKRQCLICRRRSSLDYQKRLCKKDPEAQRLKQRRLRVSNPEAFKAQELKKRYGMSLGEFKSILQEQRSRCAICEKQIDQDTACVDHNHDTGIVRGLLCCICNTGLGHFRDDPVIVQSAVYYLKERNALQGLKKKGNSTEEGI